MNEDSFQMRPWDNYKLFSEHDPAVPKDLYIKALSHELDGYEEYAEVEFALAEQWAEIRNLPDTKIRGGRSSARS